MTRRIEFTVPNEIGELYDQARGDVPMAAWIKRALESALSEAEDSSSNEQAGPESVPSNFDRLQGVRPAAPSRAPKRKPSLADTWRR